MELTTENLLAGLIAGDRVALGEAITLIESEHPEHKLEAEKLLKACLPLSGKSIRIGITGVPGVGKSTFIETFGNLLTKEGRRVAVLAVDPSSSISGGSILGDKTRMQVLSANDRVFIRPSPARNTLGGVAHRTRETIILCEAAGYESILIETVGVGQSETMVKSMVDFFLLLMLSGAGDELQGIKKGIMEMADALVITKADGENVTRANLAAAQYKNALHLFAADESGWEVPVMTCSALENRGMEEVLTVIQRFEQEQKLNGFFEKNRKEQDLTWFRQAVRELLLDYFFANAELMAYMKDLETEILKGKLTSYQGAEQIANWMKREG